MNFAKSEKFSDIQKNWVRCFVKEIHLAYELNVNNVSSKSVYLLKPNNTSNIWYKVNFLEELSNDWDITSRFMSYPRAWTRSVRWTGSSAYIYIYTRKERERWGEKWYAFNKFTEIKHKIVSSNKNKNRCTLTFFTGGVISRGEMYVIIQPFSTGRMWRMVNF